MKTTLVRYSALTALALLAIGSRSSWAGEQRALPRSVYIPVAFRTCEHLEGATLYVEDQPVAPLPAERIFVFTYYPNLKRLEPAVTELRIEATLSTDGTSFIGRLAIDPAAISTSEDRIDLGFERAKQQLAYRIDIRYDKVNVVVRCSPTCGQDHDHGGTETASLQTEAPLEVAEKQ